MKKYMHVKSGDLTGHSQNVSTNSRFFSDTETAMALSKTGLFYEKPTCKAPLLDRAQFCDMDDCSSPWWSEYAAYCKSQMKSS
jgi:hypothetical protein